VGEDSVRGIGTEDVALIHLPQDTVQWERIMLEE
jgi:hypothetical protein